MFENPAVSRARDLVLAYGWNSTSFQIVNPGIKRWFSGDGDAVVGYVPAAGFRVVAGAPVCDVGRLAEMVEAFESDAGSHGEKVCYFGAETRLEETLRDSPSHTRLLLGAQPAWKPDGWRRSVAQHRSLRAQLNRARNKGVTVLEVSSDEASNDRRLDDCLHRWLASKPLPPLHFLVEPETLKRLEHRRIFAAENSGEVVGFVTLSPVPHRRGWLFEQFPHRPGSPNGTVELMIDTAMRAIAGDGCEYATLGLSPLSKRACVEPFKNPLWLDLVLAWLRKHGQRFYNFDGLDAFKTKFRPETWEPVFAVTNETRVSLRMLYAIASAFSGNAPLRMIVGGLARAVRTEAKWLGLRLSNSAIQR